MPIPPVSRRKFIATGTTLLAGACIPSWSEAFQSTSDDAALRAEVADAALARAATLGASYADIRINRYRRESISTRERQVQNVSRSASYGLGLRVLVNGAWGFAATNRVEPAAARAAADQAVAIARANAALATRKVILANAEKVVTTWTSAFKRDPFEVPLDTKIAFLMKLNETAMAVSGVSFVSSQVLFVDEQKYFASSEGSNITQRLVRTYPQFSATAADRASGDFQTRAVVDRAQLVGRCRLGRPHIPMGFYPVPGTSLGWRHYLPMKANAPRSSRPSKPFADPRRAFSLAGQKLGHALGSAESVRNGAAPSTDFRARGNGALDRRAAASPRRGESGRSPR